MAPELCSPEVIRYYPASRRAIPDLGVGTYALLPLTPVPPLAGHSRDLHASSMPPTFVLSQDQTLQECLCLPFRGGLSRIHQPPAEPTGYPLPTCPRGHSHSRDRAAPQRPNPTPTTPPHTCQRPCETFPSHIHPFGCSLLLDRASPGVTNIMPAMTYSRAGRTTIGPGCLSAVFGMGTGVSTRAWSPAISVRGLRSPRVYGVALW